VKEVTALGNQPAIGWFSELWSSGEVRPKKPAFDLGDSERSALGQSGSWAGSPLKQSRL
jgi:hypothetical protein